MPSATDSYVIISNIGIHTSVEAVFPPSVLRDELADVGPEVTVVSTDDTSSVDALVTFVYDDAFLSAELAWIHSIQPGIDRFPLDDLGSRDIRLTNSTGIHGDCVGEMAVGYMLLFGRHLHGYRSNQHRQEWKRPEWDVPFTLDGAPVCVVGLGTLGRGIASRADALGMAITGVKRTPTEPVDHVDIIHPPTELRDPIADARFVALAVPLTDETERLIGAPELDAMRDDAILVNVARGAVVDQSALVAALRDGEIAGAALDVFETEPLPEDSPLWEMETVVVTPHAAAATREYYRRIATLVRENVRRLDENDRLANTVV